MPPLFLLLRWAALFPQGTQGFLDNADGREGANSPLGIGRASAHQFARNGARAVFVCDYSDQFLATHKREVEALYPDVDVHTRRFDAADEDAVKGVVDEAVQKYGRLDVMFANAGVGGTNKLFGDIGSEEFLRTLRTNVLRYERFFKILLSMYMFGITLLFSPMVDPG